MGNFCNLCGFTNHNLSKCQVFKEVLGTTSEQLYRLNTLIMELDECTNCQINYPSLRCSEQI